MRRHVVSGLGNAVLAKVSDNGKVCVFSLAAIDIVVDLTGYVLGEGGFG